MPRKFVLINFSLDHLQEMIASEVRSAVTSAIAQLPRAPATVAEDFLTRKETAALLHVTLTTLAEWERRRILVPERFGRRVLYKRSAVEAAPHKKCRL